MITMQQLEAHAATMPAPYEPRHRAVGATSQPRRYRARHTARRVTR